MGNNASCCGAEEAADTQIVVSDSGEETSGKRGGEVTTPTDSHTPTQTKDGSYLDHDHTDANVHDGSHNATQSDFKEQPLETNHQSDNTKDKIEQGLDVQLILQDKSRLNCRVRYDYNTQTIVMTCGKKARAIQISEVKSILHSEEHLKRIDASAGISGSVPWAAIHLESRNCIPLFFLSPDDKEVFVTRLTTIMDEKKK